MSLVRLCNPFLGFGRRAQRKKSLTVRHGNIRAYKIERGRINRKGKGTKKRREKGGLGGFQRKNPKIRKLQD